MTSGASDAAGGGGGVRLSAPNDTWRYRVVAGESVSHERQQSCCDPGCARGGGAIDDDPVVINFQPPG